MSESQLTHQYLAFISYRHADNKQTGRQWATWLHQAIETYEIPKDLVGQKNARGDVIPERIFPIFRDEEELPADADLANAITRALDNTGLLIVLCSPNAVASTYVADEIDYFKKLGRSDQIIAAMIDGEPNASWDTSKQEQGFTASDECFPKPLQYAYDANGQPTSQLAEPLAADFRVNHDGVLEQGWASVEAYRQYLKALGSVSAKVINERVTRYQAQQQLMLLKIIAGIIAVPLGALTKRDQAYQLELAQQKTKRLRQWLSGVAILAIVAIAAGFMAFFAQQRAVKNEQLATEQRDASLLNQSRFLMDRARQANSNGEHDLALLLGLNALPGRYGGERPMPDDIGQIRTAIYATNKLFHYQGAENFSQVEFNAEQGLFALSDGKLQYLSYHQMAQDQEIAAEQAIVAFAQSEDATKLVTASNKGQVTLWDSKSLTQLATTKLNVDIVQVLLSPDGSIVYTLSAMNRIIAWSVSEQKVIFDHTISNNFTNDKLLLSPDGKYLVISPVAFGKASIFDAFTGALIRHIELDISYGTTSSLARQLRFTSDSQGLLIYDNKGTRVETIVAGEIQGESSGMHALTDNSGEYMFVMSNFQPIVNDATNAEFIRGLQKAPVLWNIKTNTGGPLSHFGDVTDAAFTSDGTMLLTISYSTVRVWDVKTGTEMTTFKLQGAPKLQLKNNLLLGVSSKEKSIALWQLDKTQPHFALSPDSKVWGSQFSADGKQLLTPSHENEQRYYLIGTGQGDIQQTLTLCNSARLAANAWSKSGRYLTVNCQFNSTKVFDIKKADYLKFGQDSDDINIANIALTANEAQLVLLKSDWKSNTLSKFDIESKALLAEFKLADDITVDKLIVSETGLFALTTSYNAGGQVYNLNTAMQIATIDKLSNIDSGFFIEATQRLIVQKSKRSLLMYDLNTGELLKQLEFDSDIKSYKSHQQQFIVGLKDQELIVYDSQNAQEQHRFNTLTEPNNLTATVSNKYVILNGSKPSIYEVATGKLFYQSEDYQNQSLAFDEQNDRLLLLSNTNKVYTLPAISEGIAQAAINALPYKRHCLTNKEREENFISPLKKQQQLNRGCLGIN